MNLDNYWFLRIPTISKREIKTNKKYNKFFSPLSSNSRILEIWPGNGKLSCYIKDKFNIPDYNIHLLDSSSSVGELLKSQKETLKFNIYIYDSIEFFLQTDIKFDFIILCHVMEHMSKEYINQLVPILLNHLDAKWKILVEVPNFCNFPYWIKDCFGDYTHVTQFTQDSLAEAFLFNTNIPLKIKTYNARPQLNYHSPLEFIKSILGTISVFWSYIISRLLWGILWSRFQQGYVSTPFIIMTIEKDE